MALRMSKTILGWENSPGRSSSIKDSRLHSSLQTPTTSMPTTPMASGRTRTVSKFSKTCNFWTKRTSRKPLQVTTMTRISTRRCSMKRRRFMTPVASRSRFNPPLTPTIEMKAASIHSLQPRKNRSFRTTKEALPNLHPQALILLLKNSLIELTSTSKVNLMDWVTQLSPEPSPQISALRNTLRSRAKLSKWWSHQVYHQIMSKKVAKMESKSTALFDLRCSNKIQATLDHSKVMRANVNNNSIIE